MYLEAAKHSVEPALTVTEQDTYLYQSGWYRRVIGPFFGSDDPAFFVSVDRISSSLYAKKKRREKMADKKMVEAITSMEEDFAQWYTDVVKKAELIDYSAVKGCMIIRPAGYAIWENIQKELDRRFKETGVENVYMPMFIPESR